MASKIGSSDCGGVPPPVEVTVTQAENSEVLPPGSVAVDVIAQPLVDAVGTVSEKLVLPLASVVACPAPR